MLYSPRKYHLLPGQEPWSRLPISLRAIPKAGRFRTQHILITYILPAKRFDNIMIDGALVNMVIISTMVIAPAAYTCKSRKIRVKTRIFRRHRCCRRLQSHRLNLGMYIIIISDIIIHCHCTSCHYRYPCPDNHHLRHRRRCYCHFGRSFCH